MATIVLLPGDGIGPEVVRAARVVLDAVARIEGLTLEFDGHLVGGAAIDATGSPLPEATLAACKRADAVLLGAVGGPKWDDPSAPVRPEQGLLGLRRGLGLFANIRPVRPHPALADASPLKAARLDGVDLVFVRELTGGVYFGAKKREALDGGGERAVDTLEYTDGEIRRVVRLAFRLASERKRRVTSIDKANVLESSRLWRRVANEVAREFPSVTLEHQLVDSAAMRLVTEPAKYDVIVTENMFGDILTDEAAVLAGSLGLLPSASLGEGPEHGRGSVRSGDPFARRVRGLYEPIHGSAPDIANQGVANPLGTIASAALLLRHSLSAPAAAQRIERAVDRVLADGLRTRDLGGALGTDELTRAVVERL